MCHPHPLNSEYGYQLIIQWYYAGNMREWGCHSVMVRERGLQSLDCPKTPYPKAQSHSHTGIFSTMGEPVYQQEISFFWNSSHDALSGPIRTKRSNPAGLRTCLIGPPEYRCYPEHNYMLRVSKGSTFSERPKQRKERPSKVLVSQCDTSLL